MNIQRNKKQLLDVGKGNYALQQNWFDEKLINTLITVLKYYSY